MKVNIQAVLSPQLKARLEGVISRGVKYAEIDENGHLIFTLTDNSVTDLGKVVGDKGDPGSDAEVTAENIALALGYTPYKKPQTGIPKTDLASAVQTSLGKADSALQEHQELIVNVQYGESITSPLSWAVKQIAGVRIVCLKGTLPYIERFELTSDPAAYVAEEISELCFAKVEDATIKQCIYNRTTGWRYEEKAVYEKPSTGIPESDLTSAVQTKLNEKEVKWAEYGVTTAAQIYSWVNAGYDVKCKIRRVVHTSPYYDTISYDVYDLYDAASQGTGARFAYFSSEDGWVTASQTGAAASTSWSVNEVRKFNQDHKTLRADDIATSDSTAEDKVPSAKYLHDALAGKQDAISDLATIRGGAEAGATAYQKPTTGIPKTDLASAVQTSLDRADSGVIEYSTTPPDGNVLWYKIRELCFTAEENTDIAWDEVNTLTNIPQLQYSIGGTSDWRAYTLSTTIHLTAGQKCYWKGTTNTFSDGNGYIKFTSTGRVAASGEVDSLINYGELTVCCYYNMFYACTSLTTAPELPATTLAQNCYNSMFYGCTSITTLPALPATTLPQSCYNFMFYDCTNIKIYSSSEAGHTTPYRIPTTGTGTMGNPALTGMFDNTGGDFTGTPEINTTYYTSNEVIG